MKSFSTNLQVYRTHAARRGDWQWWHYLNFLGLDAVVVALVWQAAVARMLGTRLQLGETAALGLCVFSIYLADRLRDGFCLNDKARPRHRFALRHRRALAGILVFAVILGAGIAISALSHDILIFALAMIPVLLIYFAWTQWRGVFTESGWGKEVWVGMVFAAGVFLAPVAKSHNWNAATVWMSVGLGSLCALNCLTISYHEARAGGLKRYWVVSVLTLLFQVVSCIALPALRLYFLAILFGSLSLAGMMRYRAILNSDLVAPLADMALVLAGLLTWAA